MKLLFAKEDLLKSINIVMKAVSNRTTLPVLKCILIKASEGSILLCANDMEIAINTASNGQIFKEGAVAIDAKIFSDIVRKLPDDDVYLETDENFFSTITCGKAKFNIPGQDPDEFPESPSIEKNESLGMSQFTLKDMIRQTTFSLDLNENNKLMTGELFEIKNNVLRLVSLDGHRIAIRRLVLAANHENKRVVVPGKTLNEIAKILSDNIEDQVMIYFSPNHISFEFDDTEVFSRLIEGDYFHIDRMISGEHQTKFRVNKREFSDCIERASLLIREGENKPIILDVDDTGIDLMIQTALGSMNERVEASKEGNDIRIGFNPKFFTDALKVIDDEEIDIYMVNPKAPCFIKSWRNIFTENLTRKL